MSVFTEARVSLCRVAGDAAPAEKGLTLALRAASQDTSCFQRQCGLPPSCPSLLEKGNLFSCLHMSGTLEPETASLPLSPALRAGWEAQGNELAEISKASYLPKPACSHKSQNRVPGRAVNSEMQRQLQRKIVERNRQESCLPSPPVSEGSWSGQGHRGVTVLCTIHPLVSK